MKEDLPFIVDTPTTTTSQKTLIAFSIPYLDFRRICNSLHHCVTRYGEKKRNRVQPLVSAALKWNEFQSKQ